MANKRIQLNISGVSIIISTAEDEAYVKQLAENIEEDMQSILSKTKASITSAALLLALDYLDRFQKANRAATNMRTQIKGYLTDAANAKLLFDEEKKRSDSYMREIGELNSQLEKIQTSSPRREDISKIMEGHSALVEERNSLISQLEQANRMLQGADISRDEEINRLRSEANGYLEQIEAQAGQISALEQMLQKRQDEVNQLIEELELLEGLMKEGIAPKEQQILPFTEMNAPQQAAMERVLYEDNYTQEPPPLFRPETPIDNNTYEFDDMPNLNWTENI